ncbi:MAG: YceI family protein [Bdellovibrionales bacterium]|nr:YceI family protein [Oligoflexia bacterium]
MKKLTLSLFLLAFSLPALAAKPAAPATLKLDTQVSKAVWTGKKISGSHTGFVLFKEGSFQMKNGAPASGRVVVDMTSVTCEDLKNDPESKAKLEKHLKGPDFFNIEKYPTAEFKMKSFEEMQTFAPGGPNAIARGDLTVRGVTHPAEVRFVYTPNDIGFTAKGKLQIDRTAHGVKYNSKKFYDMKALGDKLIEDQFEVELDLSAKGKT